MTTLLKIRLLLILRYLFLFILSCLGIGASILAQTSEQGRVAIFGDSIAYAGRWVNEVENALRADKRFVSCKIVNFAVPSETVAGLSEFGHAGGRFPRPCLHERLNRILSMYEPQLILACYGMNDGLMMPFDEARFQAYQIGCSRLKAAADSAKSKIVFITPPVFQGDADKKAEYDAVLDKYAEWLISQKNSGWRVIDIRPGLRSRIAEAKTKNPGFLYSGDGVHPCSLGHHMIAQEVINGLVSELGLDHKVMEKEHRPTSETLKKHEDIRNEWLLKTKHARPGVPGYDPEMAKQQLPKMISTWNGFIREEFVIGGRRAWIVFPRNAGESTKKQLWIWRPQFFDYKPIADLELLKRGFALAFISMEDLYGSPKSMEIMDQFYKYLVNERNFAPKTVLIGLSRGGLYSLNWAEKNPQYVAGIYVDAPVCDFKSWPGGKGKGNGSSADWEKCLKAYGFTEEEALAYQGNPVDNMSKMAKAGVPLLFISRTEDNEVPIEENTDIFAKRYTKLGAPVRVIRRPGGHHPHGFSNPAHIVDFVLSVTGQTSPLRVVCVGDSNTFGVGVAGANKDVLRWSYLLAQKLQKKSEGKEVEVLNCGINGHTLLTKGDLPYVRSGEYQNALNSHAQIAIIALGTNDAKPQNRKFLSEFKQNYADMIAKLRENMPGIQIYCAIPLPSWQSADQIDKETVKKTIVPLVKQVAKENNCKTIDFFTPFQNHPEFFPDGVHPNAEGQVMMADVVFNELVNK